MDELAPACSGLNPSQHQKQNLQGQSLEIKELKIRSTKLLTFLAERAHETRHGFQITNPSPNPLPFNFLHLKKIIQTFPEVRVDCCGGVGGLITFGQ